MDLGTYSIYNSFPALPDFQVIFKYMFRYPTCIKKKSATTTTKLDFTSLSSLFFTPLDYKK